MARGSRASLWIELGWAGKLAYNPGFGEWRPFDIKPCDIGATTRWGNGRNGPAHARYHNVVAIRWADSRVGFSQTVQRFETTG